MVYGTGFTTLYSLWFSINRLILGFLKNHNWLVVEPYPIFFPFAMLHRLGVWLVSCMLLAVLARATVVVWLKYVTVMAPLFHVRHEDRGQLFLHFHRGPLHGCIEQRVAQHFVQAIRVYTLSLLQCGRCHRLHAR